MIEAICLEKLVDGTELFSSSSFVLPDCGFFQVVSPNGTGKSTLLRILAGFDLNHGGKFSYNGMVIDKKTSDAYSSQVVSYISQDPVIFEDETVLSNLLLPSRHNDEEKAVALMKAVGLSSLENEVAKNLSSGEKERLSLAMALYKNPGIILADEITANLDKDNASMIVSILKKEAEHSLVVFVTHEPDLQDESSGFISIKEGKICVTELKQKPKTISSNFQAKPRFSSLAKCLQGDRFFYGVLSFLTLAFSCLSVFFGSYYSFFGSDASSKERMLNYASESYLQNASLVSIDPSIPLSTVSLFTNEESEILNVDYSSSTGKTGPGSRLTGAFYLPDAADFESFGLKIYSRGQGLPVGHYPTASDEVMVSDLCYSSLLSNYAQENHLDPSVLEEHFFEYYVLPGSFKSSRVCGLYRSYDVPKVISENRYFASSVRERASFAGCCEGVYGLTSNSNFQSSVSSQPIRYLKNSVFASLGLKKEAVNKAITYDIVSSFSRDETQGACYSVCFDGRQNLVNSRLKKGLYSNFSYVFSLTFLLLGLSSSLVFFFRENKRFCALRIVGVSRKEELTETGSFFLVLESLSVGLGFGAGFSCLKIADDSFKSHLIGRAVSAYYISSNSYTLILVGLFLAIASFFLVLSLKVAPKDLTKALQKWSQK